MEEMENMEEAGRGAAEAPLPLPEPTEAPPEPAEAPPEAPSEEPPVEAEVPEEAPASGPEEPPPADSAEAETGAEETGAAAEVEPAGEVEQQEPISEEAPGPEEASEAEVAEKQSAGSRTGSVEGGLEEEKEKKEGGGEEEEEEEGTAPAVLSVTETLEALEPREAPSVPALPTDATFATGELLEPPPLQTGVELGRRISMSLRDLERLPHSGVTLELGSSAGSSEAEEAAVETASELEQRLAAEQLRRQELAEQYRQLLLERARLQHYNAKLQSKLSELLNKAKSKERVRQELEQHISDKEQRYSRYLAMLDELRTQQADEALWFQKQIDDARVSCSEKLAKVESAWKSHQALKLEVAVYTVGRRLGSKQAAIDRVKQIQAREQSKEREMTEVRLENIKLKHRIQKLDASLKAMEQLAEGLHLIDFEQLKIENQTYNEKIEERNEELMKLRKKITNTVQILTQVKEKLQFVEAENHGQRAQLMAVEALVAQRREILTKTKQARDKLRMDNQRLYQKCGLLGNSLLLRDYEDKVTAVELLNERLEKLKRHHAAISLTCKGVKKKIKGVTSFLPL
ncbi:coiled-coil domain-containing protein 96 [Zootoca vivipara]|uniref:coiled-coil domain-containing protein 96 n=1 Tax=Zootoca vivipara TaxID=8524 RepID=UPI00293C01D8|nr:coiled-coil domain-containing protein 96 [Zootoca vivipara]